MLVLAAAASPVYAQDEESGGEVLCSLHGTEAPAGIVPALEGNGWWIVSAGSEQDSTLSVDRVGEDCNTRPEDEAFIDRENRDPQALALDTDGGEFLWVGDIGEATDRDWITLFQINLSDYQDNAVFRYVFPGEPREIGTFLLLSGKKPLFVSADEGEATLFSPPGDNQEQDTPLEEVGTVALPEGGSVSGAAVNADGSKVALRTETAVYEWTVEGGDVVAALGGEPTVTPVADEGEAEGLAYDADGNFLTLASMPGDDGTFGTVTRYTPAAPPAAEEDSSGDEEAAAPADDGRSLVDRILDLGFGTIVNILVVLAIIGLIVMVIGIVVIRKYRKENGGGDDEDDGKEPGFAAEEGFRRKGFIADDDPVDLGIDAGHPDPDLSEVARGNVYGAARQEPTGGVYGAGPARPEPSGNVYGAGPARPEPSGNVYGAGPEPSGNVYGSGPARPEPPSNVYGGSPARSEPPSNVYGGSPARPEPSGNVYGSSPARPEPSGNVYGAGPRRETPASGVYGGREEPQYGAFEGGGNGSVYDNAGPGQSFAARPGPAAPPEPSGNVYGGPARPEPSGNVYGAGGAGARPGSVYGAGNAERTPDADDGYWGPPEGGTTYGRNR